MIILRKLRAAIRRRGPRSICRRCWCPVWLREATRWPQEAWLHWLITGVCLECFISDQEGKRS